METKLTSWTSTVTKLRSQYEWLLFFSVPKLLILYQLIRVWDEENIDECLDLVVKEVMFLVSNDSMTRNAIKEQIEVRIHTMNNEYCKWSVLVANCV